MLEEPNRQVLQDGAGRSTTTRLGTCPRIHLYEEVGEERRERTVTEERISNPVDAIRRRRASTVSVQAFSLTHTIERFPFGRTSTSSTGSFSARM